MNKIKSREALFSYFEEYSSTRKNEISEHKVRKPLLKTFVIETYRPGEKNISPKDLFQDHSGIILSQQIDECLYSVNLEKNGEDYLEKINDRFWLLYSLEKSSIIDSLVSRVIRKNSMLDHLWVSGKLFNVFWENLIRDCDDHRFVRMSFEFEDYFSQVVNEAKNEKLDDLEENREFFERQISRIGFTERKDVIDRILPGLQSLLPSFYVSSLLRFPAASGSGGHDFYFSGKVTNRSDGFIDHRFQIQTICGMYEKITSHIEDKVWFNVEKQNIKIDGNFHNLKGTPITIVFQNELCENKFNNFIQVTFEKQHGPFRLWGQPIRVNPRLVHLYGIDMHLWQEIYLEMTPKQFTLILPEGTCGNTVHRLVTNIQRFLEPQITVSIGEEDYDQLSSQITLTNKQ